MFCPVRRRMRRSLVHPGRGIMPARRRRANSVAAAARSLPRQPACACRTSDHFQSQLRPADGAGRRKLGEGQRHVDAKQAGLEHPGVAGDAGSGGAGTAWPAGSGGYRGGGGSGPGPMVAVRRQGGGAAGPQAVARAAQRQVRRRPRAHPRGRMPPPTTTSTSSAPTRTSPPPPRRCRSRPGPSSMPAWWPSRAPSGSRTC